MKPKRRASDRQPPIAELFRLLEKRNAAPAAARRSDAEINRRFRRHRAVLVLDMAGFSVSVQRHGIIHHLGLISLMRRNVGARVLAAGGDIVNFVADNALAVFRTVPAALRAALAINEHFATHNLSAPESRRIHVSIGIGHGPVLLARDDVFGDEVNLASKLGEDLAQSGEILLTASAHQRLGRRSRRFEEIDLSVSGLHFRAFKFATKP